MEKLHEGQKAAIYKELALKDILTGLYSRNAYDEWERDNQHPDKTAIVMLDLNNLKKCNDRYGHEAGDTYLKKASEMITNAFSQENTVYRIGGDEFCVIMPDAKYQTAAGGMSNACPHVETGCGKSTKGTSGRTSSGTSGMSAGGFRAGGLSGKYNRNHGLCKEK
jgi:diguanylate cyclase (GGDEF)-like protein